MPTILINTNINKNYGQTQGSGAATNGSEGSLSPGESLDDEFRKDLNLIVAKMLNKTNMVSPRSGFSLNYVH